MVPVGALMTAALAPWDAWYLQWLALACLAAAALSAPTRRRAALAGWCFSVGWLTSSLWWLYISMHVFGEMPAVMAGAGVLVLAMLLSLYWAFAMAAVAWLRTGRAWMDGLLFMGAGLLAELCRATWFTGFPWSTPGYAHTDSPLAGLAPWIGVYGLTALSLLWGAWLAQWRRAWPLLLAGLTLPLAAHWAPNVFTQPTGDLSVSLLQPNVPQDVKFDPQHLSENLGRLRDDILAAPGELVVTPETVVPVPQVALDPAYWAELTTPFLTSGRSLLVGAFLGDDEHGYANSMVGVSRAQARSGRDYAYGKHHLLPFGEFIPTGLHWFVELMNIPLGDQARGTSEAPFLVDGQRVRPLICYENLFGEDWAESVVGPQSATILVNVSNLAWFGRVMMQDHDLQFSRMRAMEFQRPFIRATNTGDTVSIDPWGRVTASVPAWTHNRLDTTVEGRTGDTPYARWLAACGLWPLFVLGVVCLLPSVLRRRRMLRP